MIIENHAWLPRRGAARRVVNGRVSVRTLAAVNAIVCDVGRIRYAARVFAYYISN